MEKLFVVFDIGGTKIRVSASSDGERIEAPIVIPTPNFFDEGVHVLRESILRLVQGRKISSIAGGIAGPLDKEKTMLVKAPNLPEWVGKPLKLILERELKTHVFIENDAALAGLGEAHFGAGKLKSIVAYLTISTGVGGVRIVDGLIDRNDKGFEPGHQIIHKNGELCPGCGRRGHLEGHIGGAALTKRFGKRPEKIHDPKVWDNIAFDLAVGLNNIIVHWSADIVILGGSLMEKINLEKVKEYLADILQIYPIIPKIVRSELNEASGLYGALALLKLEKLLKQ
ncbi:MAG: N-acylmannosamine kinase [Patescibacteria group bacterium]|nr:MAG: N-acylmannosamine kinase [Patescibacteria group bacterium]